MKYQIPLLPHCKVAVMNFHTTLLTHCFQYCHFDMKSQYQKFCTFHVIILLFWPCLTFYFPRNVNPVIRKCQYGFFQVTHARKVSPSHSSSTRDLERLFWHLWLGKIHTGTSSSQDWSNTTVMVHRSTFFRTALFGTFLDMIFMR